MMSNEEWSSRCESANNINTVVNATSFDTVNRQQTLKEKRREMLSKILSQREKEIIALRFGCQSCGYVWYKEVEDDDDDYLIKGENTMIIFMIFVLIFAIYFKNLFSVILLLIIGSMYFDTAALGEFWTEYSWHVVIGIWVFAFYALWKDHKDETENAVIEELPIVNPEEEHKAKIMNNKIKNHENDLINIKNLLDKDLITQKEYDIERKKIMLRF